MKRILWMTLAGAALTALAVIGVTMPAATQRLDGGRPSTTVMGAYHIHTDRSDGSGTVADVARAAARAGLQFVIITDHGDGTTFPEPPRYLDGVLVIDAVEVSSNDGHIVALGLPGPSPYPLGGEGRDVIEDVRRLGGWTVAAHPDSPKPDLRWRGPATDAIEWMNADSEWRDDPAWRVLQSAVQAIIRPSPAMARLFSRPQATFRRWDQWGRDNPVVGLAAVDAHARIGVDEREEPRASRTVLARPSYEHMFKTLVQGVWLDTPPTGAADNDAAAVLTALRRGRTYSAVTAFASPALLDTVVDDRRITASVPGAPDTRLELWHRGRRLGHGTGTVSVEWSEPGLYRLEGYRPGLAAPWLVSAPLFVPMPSPAAPPPPSESPAQFTIESARDWHVERHPQSDATVTALGSGAALEFQLAGGRPAGQYAALVHPVPTDRGIDEVTFDIRADRPMRISVQVKLPESAGGERWRHSVYVDQTRRRVRVRLEDFVPADRPTTRRPISTHLQSVLFVVDAPHTPPGSRGRLEVTSVVLRGPASGPDREDQVERPGRE